jgi:hypothetical protein
MQSLALVGDVEVRNDVICVASGIVGVHRKMWQEAVEVEGL